MIAASRRRRGTFTQPASLPVGPDPRPACLVATSVGHGTTCSMLHQHPHHRQLPAQRLPGGLVPRC